MRDFIVNNIIITENISIFKNGGDWLYEKFKQLLDERGITTYRVAKDTGIPQAMFCDWKSGKSSPKTEKLVKIAKYFGVPIGYFFGYEDENTNKYGYIPEREIVIHIGEKGIHGDIDPVRVYIDGEKIENLKEFQFEAKLGKPPEMIVKKAFTNEFYRGYAPKVVRTNEAQEEQENKDVDAR